MMKPLVMSQRDSQIPDLTNSNVKSWNLVLNTIFVRKRLTQPYLQRPVCVHLFTQIIIKHVLQIRKNSKTRRENPCTSKTIRHPELDLEFITPRSLTLVIDYFTINSDYYAYLILIRRTATNVLLASVFTLHRFQLLSIQWWDPFICEKYR